MQKTLFGSLLLSLILCSSAFAVVPDAVKKIHKATAGVCNAGNNVNNITDEYKLNASGSITLYVIPCTTGTTTSYSRAYVTAPDGDAVSVTQVAVLNYSENAKGVVAQLDLGDVTFDAATKTLKTNVRSTGLGDCGNSSVTKVSVGEYEILSVKTTSVRAKPACDGRRSTWPVIFSQR